MMQDRGGWDAKVGEDFLPTVFLRTLIWRVTAVMTFVPGTFDSEDDVGPTRSVEAQDADFLTHSGLMRITLHVTGVEQSGHPHHHAVPRSPHLPFASSFPCGPADLLVYSSSIVWSGGNGMLSHESQVWCCSACLYP